MRVLIVYCHPSPASFTAAVRDQIVAGLDAKGTAYRIADLYAEGFDPVLSAQDLAGYAEAPDNRASVVGYVQDLEWADTLIFVYPTWWYGLPAMLKGWLDRVLLPGVAFTLPSSDGGAIVPKLTNITRIIVFTTGGASLWLTFLMGAPGRKTLLRGLRVVCARRCKTRFYVQYGMDDLAPGGRTAHLARVKAGIAAL